MKKFLIKLSYTVLPVFLLLFGLVAYVTLVICPRSDTGDLGNLALITFWPEYGQKIEEHEMKDTLFMKVNHTEDLRSIHVNVLTVGDSFSQQEHAGYQNYMPGEGLTVANCKRSLYDNPIQYAYNIMDWGVVDSTNIDVMVVEVGERDFALRIANFGVDKVDTSMGLTPLDGLIMGTRCGSIDASVVFFLCDKMGMTPEEVKEVFNLLTHMAQERGFKLMFMLPVDKYDLYQNYIVDNPYAHPKRINEDVREILGDIPEVLLAKFCLQPLIDNGEKDIFLFDNSHWSYKASEVVGKELSRRIKILID